MLNYENVSQQIFCFCVAFALKNVLEDKVWLQDDPRQSLRFLKMLQISAPKETNKLF